MKPDTTPTIYSFIIRFVVEDTPGEAANHAAYHGAIRHIQSAEELNFNEWNEAVEFMRRFVPIETLNDKPKPEI
jgi:hypothetical protein